MGELLKIPYVKHKSSGIPKEAVSIKLECHNWANEFPYAPIVTMALWHTDDMFIVHFEVEEESVRASALNDNEKVSNDSCVEIFLSFDDGGYYNIEANCIGTVLMSHRKGRKVDVKYAPEEVLKLIKRVSSLGREQFMNRTSEGKWTLDLEIPVKAFFNHKIDSLSKLKAKCNFYKCGDKLPKLHYISWKPIETEMPDFHRPEYFAEIEFL